MCLGIVEVHTHKHTTTLKLTAQTFTICILPCRDKAGKLGLHSQWIFALELIKKAFLACRKLVTNPVCVYYCLIEKLTPVCVGECFNIYMYSPQPTQSKARVCKLSAPPVNLISRWWLSGSHSLPSPRARWW